MITFYNSPVTQIINDGYDQRDADIIESVLTSVSSIYNRLTIGSNNLAIRNLDG